LRIYEIRDAGFRRLGEFSSGDRRLFQRRKSLSNVSPVEVRASMKRRLQVFVSSTYSDLLSERQAAVGAILKAGHIPAGMELFTAGDKSQWETITRWIDESDVYMLILGGRYGSIESVTGISYTELEYDYASQQGKPLFAVVIKEDALEKKIRDGGGAMLERENPQALRIFRDKVLSNISSFFSDEKDIRLCVHESLADLRDSPSIKGWISAADVEETKPLHEEIARLREENARLFKELQKAPKSAPSPAKGSTEDNFDNLIDILKRTIVKIPDTLTSKKNLEMNLLDLFTTCKEALINGVTNSMSSNDTETFYYHNVCPKLMLHGLVENEKVAGVSFRRSYVTSRGMALLAELERRSRENTAN
jgi:hypothetical protein